MKEARKFRQVCSSCRNRLANLKVIVAQLRPSKISCSRSRTLLGHEKNVHYSAVHYGALTSPTYFAFSWLECEVWRARTEAYHKTCRNPEVSVMLLRHLLFPVYFIFLPYRFRIPVCLFHSGKERLLQRSINLR